MSDDESQARIEARPRTMTRRGLARMRLGECGALIGGMCIAASLALPWYEGATTTSPSAGELGAWSTFGPAIVVLILGLLGSVALALATVLERSPALPVATAVWSTLLGLACIVAAVVRVLERPHGAATLGPAPWLALVGAVAVFAGSWQSMRDERPNLYSPIEAEQRRL